MPETAPRPDVPDEVLRPMADAETALTIAHMNPGVSVTQAEIVIELLRRNGWLSPAGVAANERQVREPTSGRGRCGGDHVAGGGQDEQG